MDESPHGGGAALGLQAKGGKQVAKMMYGELEIAELVILRGVTVRDFSSGLLVPEFRELFVAELEQTAIHFESVEVPSDDVRRRRLVTALRELAQALS